MFEDALPFWAQQGLDWRHGGPVESFGLDGRGPSGVDFKRTRVSARQLYVFCHAEALGFAPAAAAADHVYAFLTERLWRGPDQGWLRSATVDGAPKDETPDLYDYAFALFALGWRHQLRRDPAALALAHQTLDLLEARFRHPGGQGFHHALPASLPREQNPHMHLTEAMLVLARASGEARFAAVAADLVDLFETRLLRGGVLPEFFDADWTPIAGDRGRLVEPGHMLEWAWILAQHQALSGRDSARVVEGLVRWAERHGVDPQTGVTFNSVRDDGAPLDRGSRTWPNTERIKGWLGLFELTGADPRPAVAGSVDVLFARHLDPAPRGCWFDALDADGRPTAAVIPASTLYHVFLAFAEVLRLAPRFA